jgi:ABC-2 type transport system permease protein
MSFSNIFFKTLRDNRVGILAWGLGLGTLIFVGVTQYSQLLGGAGGDRAKAIAEMTKAFQSFSFLIGEITSIGTLGGFVTVRVLGIVPTLLALWVAIVAIGLIRGEEQKGTMEMLLSTPQRRGSLFSQKTLALLTALILVAVLIGLGLWGGSLVVGEDLGIFKIAETALNMVGLAAFWGAVGLLAAQLIGSRRKAAGIISALIFGSYVLNNVFETVPEVKWISWLIPAHYYNLSKPLVPGLEFHWDAWLVLVALAVVIAAVAGWMFARRDVGAIFSFLPGTSAYGGSEGNGGSNSMLGSVFGKSMRDLLVPSVIWGISIGTFGAVMVATTSQMLAPMQEILKNLSWMARIMGEASTNEGYLSLAIFNYIPALLAVFAILQIDAWASDEEEGRLGMQIAEPVPRWQILVARYAAIFISLVIILAITGAFILVTANVVNLELSTSRVIEGLLATMPVALVVVAFGLFLATWPNRPSYAMPITIAIVVVMFFVETLGPAFDLPEAVRNLSVFHLYGRPLVEGIKIGGVVALSIATLLFAAGSIVGFNRRDLVK